MIDTTKFLMKPAKLTDKDMKRLLGSYYGNVVIINNTNSEVPPKTFGPRPHWDEFDANYAAMVKEYIDALLNNKAVVARTLCMQIKESEYCGYGEWTKHGKILTPTRAGTCTVTNYLIWDGQYRLLNPGAWLGTCHFGTSDDAALYGASDATFTGALFKTFQAAIAEKCKKFELCK